MYELEKDKCTSLLELYPVGNTRCVACRDAILDGEATNRSHLERASRLQLPGVYRIQARPTSHSKFPQDSS